MPSRSRLAVQLAAGRAVAAAYPRVTYRDASTHPDFTTASTLFRDADHLNRAGARAFSAVLEAEAACGVARPPLPAHQPPPSIDPS